MSSLENMPYKFLITYTNFVTNLKFEVTFDTNLKLHNDTKMHFDLLPPIGENVIEFFCAAMCNYYEWYIQYT